MAMPALAVAAVVVPPIVMITCRQRVAPALLLYVAALAMLVAWVSAANAHMDWADRTGGQGSAFAGSGWLLAAVAAAGGALFLATRHPRAAAPA